MRTFVPQWGPDTSVTCSTSPFLRPRLSSTTAHLSSRLHTIVILQAAGGENYAKIRKIRETGEISRNSHSYHNFVAVTYSHRGNIISMHIAYPKNEVKILITCFVMMRSISVSIRVIVELTLPFNFNFFNKTDNFAAQTLTNKPSNPMCTEFELCEKRTLCQTRGHIFKITQSAYSAKCLQNRLIRMHHDQDSTGWTLMKVGHRLEWLMYSF